jgi:hypothetical protein
MVQKKEILIGRGEAEVFYQSGDRYANVVLSHITCGRVSL